MLKTPLLFKEGLEADITYAPGLNFALSANSPAFHLPDTADIALTKFIAALQECQNRTGTAFVIQAQQEHWPTRSRLSDFFSSHMDMAREWAIFTRLPPFWNEKPKFDHFELYAEGTWSLMKPFLQTCSVQLYILIDPKTSVDDKQVHAAISGLVHSLHFIDEKTNEVVSGEPSDYHNMINTAILPHFKNLTGAYYASAIPTRLQEFLISLITKVFEPLYLEHLSDIISLYGIPDEDRPIDEGFVYTGEQLTDDSWVDTFCNVYLPEVGELVWDMVQTFLAQNHPTIAEKAIICNLPYRFRLLAFCPIMPAGQGVIIPFTPFWCPSFMKDISTQFRDADAGLQLATFMVQPAAMLPCQKLRGSLQKPGDMENKFLFNSRATTILHLFAYRHPSNVITYRTKDVDSSLGEPRFHDFIRLYFGHRSTFHNYHDEINQHLPKVWPNPAPVPKKWELDPMLAKDVIHPLLVKWRKAARSVLGAGITIGVERPLHKATPEITQALVDIVVPYESPVDWQRLLNHLCWPYLNFKGGQNGDRLTDPLIRSIYSDFILLEQQIKPFLLHRKSIQHFHTRLAELVPSPDITSRKPNQEETLWIGGPIDDDLVVNDDGSGPRSPKAAKGDKDNKLEDGGDDHTGAEYTERLEKRRRMIEDSVKPLGGFMNKVLGKVVYGSLPVKRPGIKGPGGVAHPELLRLRDNFKDGYIGNLIFQHSFGAGLVERRSYLDLNDDEKKKFKADHQELFDLAAQSFTTQEADQDELEKVTDRIMRSRTEGKDKRLLDMKGEKKKWNKVLGPNDGVEKPIVSTRKRKASSTAVAPTSASSSSSSSLSPSSKRKTKKSKN